MKTSLPAPSSREIAALRARLVDADATLHAIRNGEVDAVIGSGRQGQVFMLAGAEHAYRMLIESMHEGALTLTADKMILFANQCFARMVKCPLEEVTGGSFRRFLSVTDRTLLRPLMKRAANTGSKLQVQLHATDGSLVPAQLSIRELANEGSKDVIIGMVVTDMTASRRTEALLRALTHRVVQVQEAERGQVAAELHDNITQLLCAVLMRSQTLADQLAISNGPARDEALLLRKLLGQTAAEVERITRNLRPGVLELLGLDAVLRTTSTEFTARTGVAVKLACVVLTARLPADTELALYRILQEALKNVQKHARARQVSVQLTRQRASVRLIIQDDGIGFDSEHPPVKRGSSSGLGLLGMRERAAYVGGVLSIKAARRAGTKITVSMPLPSTPKTSTPSDL
ncbi:MAG TPA: histidine kinase [Verrucomicrobiales bacterium]|nr:histidine kinase [Verrucomicrobiales bacterium]